MPTKRRRRIFLAVSVLLWIAWAVTSYDDPYIPPNAGIPPAHRIAVTATAYSSTTDQTDDTPFMADCGPVRSGTVALSRDLFVRYPCGTVVSLDGQRYVVNDTMAARFRRRADIWMASRRAAIQYGVRRGTTLGVPND